MTNVTFGQFATGVGAAMTLLGLIDLGVKWPLTEIPFSLLIGVVVLVLGLVALKQEFK